MFTRFVITLGVMAALSLGVNNINVDKLKNGALEKLDTVALSVLDSALVTYHSAHGYTLPDRLDVSALEAMGVTHIDLDKFDYVKVSDNKFVLSCNLNNSGKWVQSFHSDVILPTDGLNSEFLLANGGTIDGDETDVDVSKKSVFIGDDVTIHGSVKVGDGSYGDGKHTFTHNYTIGPSANVNSDQVNIADNTQIGSGSNIRNFVEIIGDNISIGDRVTLWSESTVGDNVNIMNADKGNMIFQTKVPAGTTIKRTGTGGGDLTFYSGSTIVGGTNEIYNESDGNIDIYTKLPKDTTIRRTGNGKGDIVYNLSSTIGGSHEIRNDSDSELEINCEVAEGTKFTRCGTGIGKLTLSEESSLNGECGIINETNHDMVFNASLDNAEFRYTGGGNANLNVTSQANLRGKSEIRNEGISTITFAGKMVDGSILRKTGLGSGGVSVKNTLIEGTCEFYNSSDGEMAIALSSIPDGFKIENARPHGSIGLYDRLRAEPGGFFRIEAADDYKGRSRVSNWCHDLTIKDFTINVSGNGSGAIDLCANKFGGKLNICVEGGSGFNIDVDNLNWNNNYIGFYMYSFTGLNVEKYTYLRTTNIGKHLYIDSSIGCALKGSYADNTKLVFDGCDTGMIYLYGNNSGTIKIHCNIPSGVALHSYIDLHDGHEITYNAKKTGYLIVKKGSILAGKFTVNNDSDFHVYIDGANIGDGAVINVSENNKSSIYIKKDIPAGAVVNY